MADLLIENIAISGLSSCHLRRSARASHIRIELRLDRSLLIVIPARTREDQWLTFVLSKRAWIERTLRRTVNHQAGSRPGGTSQFPKQIELLSTGQKFELSRTAGSCSRAKLAGCVLNMVCVKSSDTEAYRLLRNWLISHARQEFSARLQQISNTTGLNWNKLSIRGQKTRWGSCSAKKNISLNYKLLFLPPNLVDHVLLHELVHTRELNHSIRFWDCMKQFDAECTFHRAELKKAGQLLPDWLGNI